MTLTMITSALAKGANRMSLDAWAADEEMRAQKVALFRDYAEGDHRANLTTEMRKALRINSTGSLNEFNDNYCQVILDTMNDRLHMTGIDADNDAARGWVAAILKDNRVDGLQTDIHDATLRDAETFVLVDMEEKPDGTRRVRLTHEEAYDGSYGMLVHYETTSSKTPLWAVRIWRTSSEMIADTIRVNVYYADRIERYISREAAAGTIGSLVPYADDGEAAVQAWTLPNGEPIGVPVVPFRNRGKQRGISEIENVIPLQDALNRTMYSMVYSAEMSAFDIKGLVGAQMPAAITPGMTLSFNVKDASGNVTAPGSELVQKWLDGIRFLQFEQATLEPYIAQAQWLIEQIFDVTNTPREGAADAASGESLKQREIKLIGKCERFQTKNGNAWEDVIELAHRVQQAFGTEQPPVYETFTAKWQPAEIRDDQQTIDTVMRLWNNGNGLLDDQTAVEEIAPFFDWDETKQQEIVARIQAQRQMQMALQNAQQAPQRGQGSAQRGQGQGATPRPILTLDEAITELARAG